ncbi:glyoxalase [Mesorhizobium waimense]|uniref:Glyoxalase n=1 Tax=Mesorhizobium waimense TaxID=1300307 RepID=A0A3A5KXG1_9HYPH|nr:VOC family protein [Mesorhizobium waimense]RJT41450.1 glyoxalase [Mesorhizobium waimense]
MIRINRLAYATIETPDLDRQSDYYREVLGLTAGYSDRKTIFLHAALDRHSVILRSGDRAACTELGLHIAHHENLSALQTQLASNGVVVERRSDSQPGVADSLVFTDPKGTMITVFNEPEQPVPTTGGVGAAPTTIGHVAFNVEDVAATVDFYCNVLGFRFSDAIEDFFVWLRCNPNHHSVNFVRGKRIKMHHLAFEVRDWNHLQTSCDFLSKAGYPTIWGPGRHGCGHNIFTYHRDPDGNIIELFAELDQMREELGYFEPRPWHRQRPQQPKVWPSNPAASNLWGPMPPPDFLD